MNDTGSRLRLAQLPTPLERAERLGEAWGGPRIWIKRDDLSGFGLSGNKVRKLEYHLGAAFDAGATTLVTCGAVQSNHCRATALAAARTGLGCVLVLRSDDGHAPTERQGNHLLQLLAGAEIRFITPRQWHDRGQIMQGIAQELQSDGEQAWLIPEGASDHLGVLAFEAAALELIEQVGHQIGRPVTIWHASSSGATTAGLALGVHRAKGAARVVGSSVGESAAQMTMVIDRLLANEGGIEPSYRVIDDYVGEGYGRTTAEELAVQVQATRATGLIWDPTYTGKALYALWSEIRAGRFSEDDDVVFWHTGGGFAVFAHDFAPAL